MKKAFYKAFSYTIPILTGYLFMGIAFGILLNKAGYNFIWAFFMALFMFAGSMQFVAVELLKQPFNLINVAIMSLLVNARHLFYGISMFDKFDKTGKLKPYMIHALTDETYSILCSVNIGKDVSERWFYFFVAFLNHLYWITGCTLGAILGSFMNFNSKGIDFTMTALFIVIFIEQWENSKNHIPSVIGLSVTALSLFIFGKNRFIIISMIGIFILLLILREKIESE